MYHHSHSFLLLRYHFKAIESVPVVTNDDLKIELKSIKCPSCPDPSEVNISIFCFIFLYFLKVILFLHVVAQCNRCVTQSQP